MVNAFTRVKGYDILPNTLGTGEMAETNYKFIKSKKVSLNECSVSQEKL